MKKIFSLLALVCAFLAGGAPLNIVVNGKSEYVIVVPPKSLPGPREAAKELQYLIQKATGALLPIVAEQGGKKAIVISSGKNLAPEAFQISSRNGSLYITGDDGTGNPRRFAHTEYNRAGSWFGVNYIAEKFLDFRHFFPGEKGIYLPKRKNLTIPELNITQAPKMVYRNFTIWYHVTDRKYRLEMDLWKRRAYLGESLGWYNNHMWRYILPPEKYLAKHPEWFAMLNGRRSKEIFAGDEGLKICTSNMEALKEFTRVSVERARQAKSRYISITPNDGIRFCECPECTRDDLKAADGSVIMSNRMFRYANVLAELITKELPNVKISMLAYSHYKEPPTKVLKLHPAIEVMYVFNTADSLYHIPRIRAKIKNDLKEWQKRQPVLYFYNTPGDPAHMPLLNIGNLKKLFADLAEVGVTGYAIENSESFWSSGINNYIYSRMCYDPGADFEALYKDSLEKCYGKAAAPAVRAYHEDVSAGRKKYEEFAAPKKVDYRSRLGVMLDMCWNNLYEKHYSTLEKLLAKTPDPGQNARLKMLLSNLKYVKMTVDLHREVKRIRSIATPANADAARVVKMAEERRNYISQIHKQHPEVVPERLYKQEAWYRLSFDPALLKKQLLRKKPPFTMVAYGKQYPRKAVIGAEMETGAPVKVKGHCSFVGDNEALTVNVHMDEPLMKAIDDVHTAPNSAVWEENCVDLFFDPGCDGKGLIHLISNSKGTLFASKEGVKKWEHKITVTPRQGKNFWSVQIRIPWSDLGGKPERGTIWGFNAGRVRKTESPAVYSCWSPTYGLFCTPEFFGRLIF